MRSRFHQGPPCVAVSYNHQAAIHHRSLCRGDLVSGLRRPSCFSFVRRVWQFFVPVRPFRRFSARQNLTIQSRRLVFSATAAARTAFVSTANFISSASLHLAETGVLVSRRRFLLATYDVSRPRLAPVFSPPSTADCARALAIFASSHLTSRHARQMKLRHERVRRSSVHS